VADWYGKQQLFFNKLDSPQEKIKKIQRVTVKDIKKVVEEVFDDRKISLAIIGPFKDKQEFAKLLKF